MSSKPAQQNSKNKLMFNFEESPYFYLPRDSKKVPFTSLQIYYLTVKKFTEKNCRQIFSFDSSLNITHITIIFTLILISQFPSYSEASISQPPVPQWHPFPQKYLSSIWNPYCDYDCPLT